MEMIYLRRDQKISTSIERVQEALASNVLKPFSRQKESGFERTCMKTWICLLCQGGIGLFQQSCSTLTSQ
jgi:hypothetical protein